VVHVVLLGDSIFDNAAYVPGQPDVVRQLRAKLPAGSQATLCAVDGSVTRDVERQLRNLPIGATHLVVSVGGNDALEHIGMFQDPATSVGEVVARLADIREQFGASYRRMVDAVLRQGLPVALCTIYEGRFEDPLEQRLVATGLTVFNDVITRESFARGLSLIDLRLICNAPADYANPIEPSAQGGDKIATVITELVTQTSRPLGSVVFAR
jgi:hypothetical protein